MPFPQAEAEAVAAGTELLSEVDGVVAACALEAAAVAVALGGPVVVLPNGALVLPSAVLDVAEGTPATGSSTLLCATGSELGADTSEVATALPRPAPVVRGALGVGRAALDAVAERERAAFVLKGAPGPLVLSGWTAASKHC
jgi:hypothetical protein